MKLKFIKSRKRIIAFVTALAVVAGAVIGVSISKPTPAYAKVTLRGIESLVEEHSVTADDENPKPFVILEVVPKLEDAKLGFLVGGEEPIKDGKSIKDMPSAKERIENLESENVPKTGYNPNNDPSDVVKGLIEKGAFSFSTYNELPSDSEEGSSWDIRGKFIGSKDQYGNDNGLYSENTGAGDYEKKYGNPDDPNEEALDDVTTIYGDNNTAGDVLYRKTDAFRKADDFYLGHYSFSIKKVDDSSLIPVHIKNTDDAEKIYNYQFFSATQVTDTDMFEEGQYIYVCTVGSSGDNLDYYGEVKKLNDGVEDYLAIKLKDGSVIDIRTLMSALMMFAPPVPYSETTPDDEETPEGTTPEGTTPEGTTPEGTTPEGTTPEGTTPEGTTPEGTTPEGTTPEGTTPEGTTPEGTTPEGTTPEGTTPEGTTPEESTTQARTLAISSSVFEKYGYISSNTKSKAVLGAMRDDRTYDYYIVKEVNNAEADCYIIDESVAIDTSAGPYGRRLGFSKVEGSQYYASNAAKERGPYYVKTSSKDEFEYVYTESPLKYGEYVFKSDYSQQVYQIAKYKGGFNNNEWFKQFVFDRELENSKECSNLYIDVVPVTMDMLEDYVDSANLIYFAGGRYDTDIKDKTAINILDKVVSENFPVILERSTYYTNLYNGTLGTDDEKKERTNLSLLALELMQSSLASVSLENWTSLTTAFANEDTTDFNDKTKTTTLEKRIGLIKTMFNAGGVNTDDTEKTYKAIRKNSINDISYVNGTVFVNDDWNDGWDNGDGTFGKIIETARIYNGDFNEQYSDAKLDGIKGFQAIADEYESEKPIIETYGNWSNFNSKISKATSIRYILNANNNRNVVKTNLNILDIEPYESAQYTDDELLTNIYMNNWGGKLWNAKNGFEHRDNIDRDWIYANIVDATTEEQKKAYTIGIKQMGTKEFIGRNDDLNAKYDMIYIGMDTAIMNTDNRESEDGWNFRKRDITIYNDSKLDRLVYSHVGESYTVTGWFAQDGRLANTSGNDITRDKVRELTDYVNAGYAVLLSDDFFDIDSDGTVTGINTKKLDVSSNLYQFVKDVVLAKDGDTYKYFGKNIYRRGALESKTVGFASARQTFTKYLNIAKLNITLNKKPIPYAEQTGYLTPNSDGTYTLEYEVSLSNDAAVDASNTTYDCKLYLDLDADGKFEDGESLSGLVINDGSETESDGVYHLRAGNTYTITRLVPDEYVGFISWKLSFIQNEGKNQDNNAAHSIHSAVTGFTAVPATAEKPTIKVLQIAPNPGKANNLDLTGSDMLALYDQVKDFNVTVKKISAHDFLHKNDTASKANVLSYYDYLCQYDMVVIGFTDCFDLAVTEKTNDITVYVQEKDADGNVVAKEATKSKLAVYREAALAIREYALSGRSILFTHDLTSHIRMSNQQGYESTMYLRDIMGMDRYGQLKADGIDNEQYAYDSTSRIKEYVSLYDTNRLKGNEVENIGFTDADIIRLADSSKLAYGLTTREVTTDYALSDDNTPKTGNKLETVTAINEGQITQYPFIITEGVGGDTDTSTFEASITHSQYYQLNLDTDSTDENVNDDVVVWYAISNKDRKDEDPYQNSGQRGGLHEFYKALHNDVRNNYYIYSKGNVMYTGAGHSTVHSEEEKKLFVNTLVASYNSGLHSPKVIYKENPWDNSATINGIYLPYDMNLGIKDDGSVDSDFLDEKTTVNFKTINNNFRESQKNLKTRYYVTVATEGDATISYNGIYLKEIEPVDFTVYVNGNKQQYGTPHELKNYQIYQATFNTADLNMGTNVSPKDVGTIYIQIGTEDLSTGKIESLLATESLLENKLDVYTARLFDLE